MRETLEKSVVNPDDTAIKKIRAEVLERIVQSGANEATVDISIEIDQQKNILRAIATGATELRHKTALNKTLSVEQLRQIAAESVNLEAHAMIITCQTGRWSLFCGTYEKKSCFGLLKKRIARLSVVDREGVVRLKKENANWLLFQRGEIASHFAEFIDNNTRYSEANAAIPRAYLFWKEKMLDLSGMQTKDQMLSIIEMELEMEEPQQSIVAIAWQ